MLLMRKYCLPYHIHHHTCKSCSFVHVGNKETLESTPKQKGLNVREELLKFHAKYYSSNLMCLAVLCKGEFTSNKLNETLQKSFGILVVRKLRSFELFADANPLLNGLDLNLRAYCILVGRVS